MRTSAGHSATINTSVATRLGLAHDPQVLGREVIDPLIAADRQAVSQGDTSGILKAEPTRSTLRRIDLGGWGGWVVKRYFVSPWRTRLLHAVGQTPTQREARGADLLERIGRRANPPLATVRCRPIRDNSQLLILPYVEGTAADQLVGQTVGDGPKSSLRLGLAYQIGRQIGLMLRAGIVNRDHKLSNLIVDRRCLADDEPIVIDPVGLRRHRSRRQVLRLFSMLIRTTHRAGGLTTREGLTLVDAVLEAEPTLGRGLARPRHELARATLDLRRQGIG